jgi:myo-inositol 2-dehydrogenase / D-chiro-inositol 1-dehydrogenase
VSPPTRVAIVGVGAWGRQHARVFSGRSDVDVVAMVGRTQARVRARARELGTRAYTDIAAMLDAEQPDLVSVCLPNEAHFAPTLQLIRAGVALLVEKPLVFDLTEADTLLREADARNLFFAINLNHRFATPVQLAAAAVHRGDLGRLTFATWRFGGEGGKGEHPYRNLIETQCHGFDMLEYLCGPIDSVMAQATDDEGQGRSTMSIALHFSNGAVGSLIGSYDSSYAYPRTHTLELNGSTGRVLIDDTIRRFTQNRAGSETSAVWEAGYFNDPDRQFELTFDRHVDVMLTAFRSSRPPPVPARAGRRALELAIAAIQSTETGSRVATATSSARASTHDAEPESLHDKRVDP